MESPLLSCEDLHIAFSQPDGRVAEAVRGVSFTVNENETLGIVGESGCGKTMTALAVMRLVPEPAGKIISGKIRFKDIELLSLPEKQMRSVRGGSIAMIFQDPMTSLNPLYTCRTQIREAILEHGRAKEDADTVIESILAEVGIPEPKRTADSYPHQLSGGMQQRVMIAMALVCNPSLLIADEPTTALDVTVQARILDLLDSLKESKGTSLMLITHNLGIVGDIADRVMVMYAGEIMECAKTEDLFDGPMHPYSSSLLETVPSVTSRKKRLTVIPGEVPTPLNIPQGCPFHPRCDRAFQRCRTEHPDLYKTADGRLVRCFLYE